MSLYDKIFPPRKIVLSGGKTVFRPASRLPLIALILVFLTVLSVKITGFDMRVLLERGNQFFVILGMMVPPAFSYSSQVWKPLFDTIKMSLLGTVVGAVLVIPFAMAASTNIIKSPAVVSFMRLFLSIVRTLPTLVTALIATYVFGLGTLAGTTAIAVFTFAYMGAGGLGLILNEKLGWREYPSVGMILIMLFVAVFLIESVSRYCRRKLV